MRPLIPTLLTLVCCTGALPADPGPVGPGNPVRDLQREAALASHDVYYRLREVPGSRNLYMSLYELHAFSKGMEAPDQREVAILDDMVHEVEFILDRMAVPVFDPHCPYQRRCAPAKQPSLEHVAEHVHRMRELVNLMMSPPGPPIVGPSPNVKPNLVPGQPNVGPGPNVPNQVPGQPNVGPGPTVKPNQVPGQPNVGPGPTVKPNQVPGPNVPPAIPNQVPQQFEEKPEGPGAFVPGNPYPDQQEAPLNSAPQPNPTDVLITPNGAVGLNVGPTEVTENVRPTTNPNPGEFLPETLPAIPQETAPGPLLVTP